MAKFLEPGETVEFRPTDDGQVVYFLRVPSRADKIKWKSGIRAAGGRWHGDVEMRAKLRRGLERIMDPDPVTNWQSALLDDVDLALAAQAEAAVALAGAVPETEAAESLRAGLAAATEAVVAALAAMQPIAEQVQRGDEDYAAALADNAVFMEVVGLVTVQQLVTGWDGLKDAAGAPVPFSRGRNGPPESALAHIPDWHLELLGGRGSSLMSPTPAEAKN